MQLIITILLFFLVLSQEVKAQTKKFKNFDPVKDGTKDSVAITSQEYEDIDWKKIDVNYLSSYYSQDGNNGAVTGGIGTEQLWDFTQKISAKVPLTRKLTLNMDGNMDIYSSASTDNIDNIPASASSLDVRGHGNIGISIKANEQQIFDVRLGGSGEYDYTSFNGGIHYTHLSKNKNSQFNIGAQAFIDNWIPYLPVELRRERNLLTTTKRNSFNGSLGFSQVINKKMQIAFMLEATYMNGLLSTPFHRVYFQDSNNSGLELLPSSRLKVPVALRFNAYLSEWLVARTYYRYYWDSWGMKGHTLSLELPFKINRFLTVYPFYRYHTQTAVDYFAGYKEHLTSDEFRTSDYDLSALSSHAMGLGISYAPVDAMLKLKVPFVKKRHLEFSSIDLKYSHYERSTGLKADIISLGLGFKF